MVSAAAAAVAAAAVVAVAVELHTHTHTHAHTHSFPPLPHTRHPHLSYAPSYQILKKCANKWAITEASIDLTLRRIAIDKENAHLIGALLTLNDLSLVKIDLREAGQLVVSTHLNGTQRNPKDPTEPNGTQRKPTEPGLSLSFSLFLSLSLSLSHTLSLPSYHYRPPNPYILFPYIPFP